MYIKNNPEKRRKDSKKPSCPQCGRSKYVKEIKNSNVNLQLFIARPLDDFFCVECNCGF